MIMKFPGLAERKISDLFDYDGRRLYTPSKEKLKANIEIYDFGDQEILINAHKRLLETTQETPKSSCFVGIEVEVENMENNISPTGWAIDNDGSLRNNGKEFISHVLKSDIVNNQICSLFTLLNAQKPRPTFSWRTSIHFHLCVRDRTLEEIFKLFLLYSIFERPLFLFAGEEREKSIFCVPLIRSSLSEDLSGFFSQKISINKLKDNWHKYSALNITRISDYGTVEFRHLPGTWDVRKISTWAGLLISLYNASMWLSVDRIIEEVKSLNTTSKYMMFRDEVFGDTFGKELRIPDLRLISEGVSFCKECLSGINKETIQEKSSMMKYIRREADKKKEAQLEKAKRAEEPMHVFLKKMADAAKAIKKVKIINDEARVVMDEFINRI